MPSKVLVKQIDLELGEARQGIAALEAEVERLTTAREALVPSENSKAPERPATRRTARRASTRRKGSSRKGATRRVPAPATRMIAEGLLSKNSEQFTAPSFFAEHGQGRWSELTTFNVFNRFHKQGVLAKAGKDGSVQLWRVADPEKLSELVAS